MVCFEHTLLTFPLLIISRKEKQIVKIDLTPCTVTSSLHACKYKIVKNIQVFVTFFPDKFFLNISYHYKFLKRDRDKIPNYLDTVLGILLAFPSTRKANRLPRNKAARDMETTVDTVAPDLEIGIEF